MEKLEFLYFTFSSITYIFSAYDDCRRTKIRIMKTIRLEVNDLVDDIAKGPFSMIGPDYKVIVLFRDPRAIMTSIKLTPDFWTHEIQNEHYICSQINQNINALKKLPHPVSSRIRFIKYEDFVAKSDQVIEDLYAFLGISWSSIIILVVCYENEI